MAEKSAIDFATDMITFPLDCECGESWSIKAKYVISGLETVCPKCGRKGHIDEDTASRINHEFNEMLQQLQKHLGPNSKEKPKAKRRTPSKPKRPEPKGYPVGLVGESFYQNSIKHCADGDPVFLLREMNNPHDPRAIVAVSKNNETLGYIRQGSFLHRLIYDERGGCSSRILSLNTGDDGMVGVVIDVEIDDTPIGEREYSVSR